MLVLPTSMVSSIVALAVLPVATRRYRAGPSPPLERSAISRFAVSGDDVHLLDDIALCYGRPVAGGSAHDGELLVEVGMPRQGDKKLTRAGVAAGQRHPDGQWFERRRRGLATKRLAARPAETVARRIAELHHEARDHPMENDP